MVFNIKGNDSRLVVAVAYRFAALYIKFVGTQAQYDTSEDALHNSRRSVIARARAVRCVTFFANSGAIGCKKTPCGPSRSARHSSARVMKSLLNAATVENQP